MERNLKLDRWLQRNGPEATFRALAELVPGAAVVLTDADQNVLFWSAEAERIFGYSSTNVVGSPCPAGVVCDAGEIRPFGATVRVRRADGSQVYVRHYSRAFSDSDGPTGAIHLLDLDGGGHGVATALSSDAMDFHGLVTRDPGLLQVIKVIRNVAETETTVLVRGESGTGKELVARAIHLESRRKSGPYIAVNCAAFTPTLLESELFGHTKGAFTGAIQARKGIFAQANGGTLFLDEVAELPLDLQAKLLRVLQERNLVPVGGTVPQAVDVRVIAATHRSLREEVRAGRFREDLMFRLRVVPIFVPPLRQRPLDIDLLLRHFTSELSRIGPRVVHGFSPDAMRALLDYAWPGNVRELRNALEYAFAVGRGPTIEVEELPPEFREHPSQTLAPAPRQRRVANHEEKERVRAAIAEADGDMERAAAALSVSRTTFWRMRKRLDL